MAHSTHELDLGTTLVAAAATQYSDVWDARTHRLGAIGCTWKDLTHGDGTLTLQWSLDGTNYATYTTATTMAATPGGKIWEIAICGGFYRVLITKTSNTAGSVITRAIGKW